MVITASGHVRPAGLQLFNRCKWKRININHDRTSPLRFSGSTSSRKYPRYQAVSSLGGNGLLFPRSFLARLDNCETVSEHVPAVDDLQAERDLVLSGQVALAIGVTVWDFFSPHLTLNAPTDTALEVTNNSTHASICRFWSTGNGVANSSVKTKERLEVSTKPYIWVTLHARRRSVGILRLQVSKIPHSSWV